MNFVHKVPNHQSAESAVSQEKGSAVKEARAEVAMSEQLAGYTHTHAARLVIWKTETTKATTHSQKELWKTVPSLTDRVPCGGERGDRIMVGSAVAVGIEVGGWVDWKVGVISIGGRGRFQNGRRERQREHVQTSSYCKTYTYGHKL